MYLAAKVGTSGVLCAVTQAKLMLAIGWSVNPSKLYPACLLNHKRLIFSFYVYKIEKMQCVGVKVWAI